jgi:hypothetical protein
MESGVGSLHALSIDITISVLNVNKEIYDKLKLCTIACRSRIFCRRRGLYTPALRQFLSRILLARLDHDTPKWVVSNNCKVYRDMRVPSLLRLVTHVGESVDPMSILRVLVAPSRLRMQSRCRPLELNQGIVIRSICYHVK